VSVNGRGVLVDDHADIMDLLMMLKIGTLPLRLKFIRTAGVHGQPGFVNATTSNSHLAQQIIKYEERLCAQSRSTTQTDIYGFTRTHEYLIAEKAFLAVSAEMSSCRDRDWVEFLKSIGVFLLNVFSSRVNLGLAGSG
jgi:hypothetical protein